MDETEEINQRVKYGQTQSIVTQLLGQNNPLDGFVHILPRAGLVCI